MNMPNAEGATSRKLSGKEDCQQVGNLESDEGHLIHRRRKRAHQVDGLPSAPSNSQVPRQMGSHTGVRCMKTTRFDMNHIDREPE